MRRSLHAWMPIQFGLQSGHVIRHWNFGDGIEQRIHAPSLHQMPHQRGQSSRLCHQGLQHFPATCCWLRLQEMGLSFLDFWQRRGGHERRDYIPYFRRRAKVSLAPTGKHKRCFLCAGAGGRPVDDTATFWASTRACLSASSSRHWLNAGNTTSVVVLSLTSLLTLKQSSCGPLVSSLPWPFPCLGCSEGLGVGLVDRVL